jgi:hypothetical protein
VKPTIESLVAKCHERFAARRASGECATIGEQHEWVTAGKVSVLVREMLEGAIVARALGPLPPNIHSVGHALPLRAKVWSR